MHGKHGETLFDTEDLLVFLFLFACVLTPTLLLSPPPALLRGEEK